MKNLTFLLLLFLSARLFSQTPTSNVEFVGIKTQVLIAKKGTLQAIGKLSTGELVKAGCDHGACYFRIEYKGRSIQQSIGNDITKMSIYEYDFGGDGDNEIVVVNDIMKTSFIFIYFYSKGIIKELFEKEITNYRTILKKDYIEYYLPSGLNSVWNYYQGQFWGMTPFEKNEFKYGKEL
jgi:hypothetical protein